MDRLPPGQQCVETDDELRMLAIYLEAIGQAQAMDRESVRHVAAMEFDSERIVDTFVEALAEIASRIEAPTTL